MPLGGCTGCTAVPFETVDGRAVGAAPVGWTVDGSAEVRLAM